MFKNKLKRLCAVTLAGMMVMSVSACSTSKSAEKNSVSKAEQASEEQQRPQRMIRQQITLLLV